MYFCPETLKVDEKLNFDKKYVHLTILGILSLPPLILVKQ